MKGLVLTANFMLTDALTFTFTAANGAAQNKTVITAGSGDIGIAQLNKFNLLMFDVVAKF